MFRGICRLCDISDRLNLQDLAYLMFIGGGVLALFSLMVWQLILVSPVFFIVGFVMAFAGKACTACEMPADETSAKEDD